MLIPCAQTFASMQGSQGEKDNASVCSLIQRIACCHGRQTPVLRLNTMCFLIPSLSDLSLCLVSIYSCIAAMLDLPQHRLRSVFFLPCTMPDLCSAAFPITALRTCVPSHFWNLYGWGMPQTYRVWYVSLIQLRKKSLLVPLFRSAIELHSILISGFCFHNLFECLDASAIMNAYMPCLTHQQNNKLSLLFLNCLCNRHHCHQLPNLSHQHIHRQC